MKTKVLLASVAVLAGIGGLGAAQVNAADDPMTNQVDATPGTITETQPTGTGTSNATITFDAGSLKLVDVPSFDYGHHALKTAETFDAFPAEEDGGNRTMTPISANAYYDGAVTPAPATPAANKLDRATTSFLHVQDRSGANAGWNVTVQGTVPVNGATQLTDATITFAHSNIANYWVAPGSADGKLTATDDVTTADSKVLLQGTDVSKSTAVPVASLDPSKASAAAGGDFYTDFSKTGSSQMYVPAKVQKSGTFTSTLLWTLTAGVK
ncbi:WxL domain-containing protein [Lacticaseibacillus saniviri]|nr:WxL domain-containing protein [Lacticaseibacillus saniviri]MCG4281073.1 WxL domain-containing protein [Lacticaseibacillus saniviri]